MNKWLLILLVFFSCSKHEKYNVVWIVVEDQSQYFFPTYGNDEISLPNLESLANESLVFENMYATYPVCAPARSSIITGMYPSSIGTHNMRAYNGNREIRGMKNDFNPCSESESELDIPYYSSNLAEQIPSFPEILRENNYYTTNNSKRDYNFKISENVWDESSNNADWSNRSPNQPFFSVFNFAITHESSIWRRDSDKLLVNPDDLYIPPFFPNDSLTRHSYAVNYSNLILVDRQIGNLIERLKNENLYDSSYIFFYSDHGGPFPRHKRSLKDTGVKVPFYVKQPKNLREKTNTDQLLSFVDLAPTVLSILNLEIPSVYQGLAFLGSQKSKKSREFVFTASDRFDEEYDRVRSIRTKKYKYIKNYNLEKSHALDLCYRNQMPLMRHLNTLFLQKKLNEFQSLWFREPRYSEELYDLENDPFEINNLSLNDNYENELIYHRNLMNDWMKEIDDLGGIPEKELIKLISDEQ